MTVPGIFTLSLDTELAWGSFDTAGPKQYAEAYRQTPTAIERLCELCGTYDVSATWACVGHLFDDCTDHTGDGTAHETKDSARDAWLSAAPCASGVDRSLWYRPAILETITDCETEQEIGLHGYSHLIFDEHTEIAAREELAAGTETFDALGIDPSALVYPRNAIAHESLLAEYGIEVYRGVDARWYETAPVPALGTKALRYGDELFRRGPPVVTPFEQSGAVCVPGSQIFRPNRGAWAWTPSQSQFVRARKGIDRAARTGDVFHLWFHPFNIALDLEHHLSLLEDIFSYAQQRRNEGDLEVMSLSEIAEEFRDGRWS